MVKLLIEAVFVGMSLVIAGLVVTLITKRTNKKLPSTCRDWNKNYIMEITLFLIGFFLHIGFELSGVNTWYCKNGNACLSIVK